jgi:hydroxymethylbilane synthase
VSAGKLRIGTRGSPLARWQAEHVAAALRRAHAGLEVELQIVVTEGDRFQSGPLVEVGGKGVWVKEIEAGLLAGQFDLAVHSLKDVPAELAGGLALVAIPPRADARDALVSRSGASLEALPAGARLGTSSPRRVCQVKALRPDLAVEVLRGNVDTRLRKVEQGVVDAALLACAGLDRLGHGDRIVERLDPTRMLPAIGQGALALEGRADDDRIIGLCRALSDAQAEATTAAERALLAGLGGSCRTPIAGHAVLREGRLELRGLVGRPDGSELVRDQVEGAANDASALGAELARRLLARGAAAILAELG